MDPSGFQIRGASESPDSTVRESQLLTLQRARGDADSVIFQGGSDSQQQRFFESGSYDLEADRQAGGAQSARYRECRQPERVDAADEPGGGEADVLVDAAEPDGSVAKAGRGGRG